MGDKPVAVADTGSLISLALAGRKTEGEDGEGGTRTFLEDFADTFEVHVPYSVYAEVNSIAVDKNNERGDNDPECVGAKYVMDKADEVFDTVHVQEYEGPKGDLWHGGDGPSVQRTLTETSNDEFPKEDTATLAQNFDRWGTDETLAELDAVEDTNFSRQDAIQKISQAETDNQFPFVDEQETYNEKVADNYYDWDGGEMAMTGLAVEMHEGNIDGVDEVNFALCDDTSTLDAMRRQYEAHMGEDYELNTGTCGDFVGSIAEQKGLGGEFGTSDDDNPTKSAAVSATVTMLNRRGYEMHGMDDDVDKENVVQTFYDQENDEFVMATQNELDDVDGNIPSQQVTSLHDDGRGIESQMEHAGKQRNMTADAIAGSVCRNPNWSYGKNMEKDGEDRRLYMGRGEDPPRASLVELVAANRDYDDTEEFKQQLKQMDFVPRNGQGKRAGGIGGNDAQNGASWTTVQKLVDCGKNCGGCPHGPYTYNVRFEGDTMYWEYAGR